MFVKTIVKSNTKGGKRFYHYRLVESYRMNGKPRHRTLLNLGAIPLLDDAPIKRKQLANRIEDLVNGNHQLFPSYLEVELEELALKYHTELIAYHWSGGSSKDSAAANNTEQADYQSVDVNSLAHEEVREIGAEWMCKQMLDRLNLADCLLSLGWSNKWVTLSLISVISRSIYGYSEHKTAAYLRDNSGLLSLFNQAYDSVSRYHLYEVSRRLYKEKEAIESYLSRRSYELFDQKDTIILYDLTNVYFEGRKEASEKAAYGRSKEKRSDAKLIVLAVVVNVNGFIKYSQFYKGNMSDSKTLKKTIEDMERQSKTEHSEKIVVLDAGIATEGNLEMLRGKKYDYVCVSRRKLAEYKTLLDGEKIVHLKDNRGNPIEIKRLATSIIELDKSEQEEQDEQIQAEKKKKKDYFIYVWSEQKQIKEQSMEDKLLDRYAQGLETIRKGTQKKGGTKRVEKVWERIGRLKQKFSRVNTYFTITVKQQDGVVNQMSWAQKKSKVSKDKGVYFLRTTLDDTKEENLWTIYNTLKEIEYTFRVLKTDLNLRPVFHQSDENMEAHLFLGILAYQVVCAIRFELKKHNITYDWSNIVRIMSTHKIITSFLKGADKNFFITKTCRPNPNALDIYRKLNFSSMPVKTKKYVVPH